MYESWFRFRRRPFSAAPRTEDYFPSEAAEYARKATISCVQRAAGPALVIGTAGSGKTTSCQQFLSHFRTRTSAGMISCAGIASRRTFFQNLLFEIGRPYRDLDEGELRLSLVDYLTSSEAPSDGTVLIFDDAHELPTEQFEDLSMLSGLMRDNGHCVHLILSGTVRLEELLSTPKFESFNQRIAARSYLEPFRLHETEAYVRRQFDRAGAMADEVFIDGALPAIHKCTSGTPRLVNQLCDHALVLGAAGGHTKLNDHGVREAWSDLQHLPPPENAQKPRNVEDVVEFGSLDDDLDFGSDEPIENNASVSAPVDTEASDSCSSDGADEHLAEAPIADEHFDSSVEHSFDDQDGLVADRAPALADASLPRATEDRLDEISDYLDDYQSLPYPSVDPFAEEFADEEVVISRPSSMLNRLADRQPEVISQFGQDLIATLDDLVTDNGFLCSPDNIEGDRSFRLHSESDEGYGDPELSVTSFEAEYDFSEPIPEPQLEREPQELITSANIADVDDADAENERNDKERNDSVVEYAETGSYAITVDFDSPSTNSQGAVEFQAALEDVDSAEPGDFAELSEAELESKHAQGIEAPGDEFDRDTDATSHDERLSMEQVVTLAMSTPKISATNVASKVEVQELPPREVQQVVPEIRVVELNSSDAESTKPRRRFKQLFSGLAER